MPKRFQHLLAGESSTNTGVDELSKIAEQYLKARNRQLHQKKNEGLKYKTENPNNK